MEDSVRWRYQPSDGYWIDVGPGPLFGMVDEMFFPLPYGQQNDLDVQTIVEALNRLARRLRRDEAL
jgi:hypothetical protein